MQINIRSETGRTVSVGQLLRFFSVNLHDQIKHRVYFYKTAPMVRLDNAVGGREGGRKAKPSTLRD